MDLHTSILEACITVFNKKGIKFTMDDLAKELSISKKTIYSVFNDKESLLLQMVDYCFDGIKDSENKVLSDSSLSTAEKIETILGVLPDCYQNLDFSQLYLIKDKHPLVYSQIEQRLENGWENTIALLEQGMQEGVVRPIHPIIIKTIFEATLEQFLKRDLLEKNNITYQQALKETVKTLTRGIIVD